MSTVTARIYLVDMADKTSRMIALLGAMRKQMNGAVADAMRYYGDKYGLNYGVSLPTLRSIAREQGIDHELAQYLYKQQVRELQLAALHIADPDKITLNDADTWAEGIINSEMAEEMAFALLHKTKEAASIINVWSRDNREHIVYSALMAAARNAECIMSDLVEHTTKIVTSFPQSRVIAQGVVAMLLTANGCGHLSSNVADTIGSIKALASQSHVGFSAAEYIAEELEWRMAE